MNLHGIASGVICSVNPNREVVLRRCSGYSTSADGMQVPTYAKPITGVVQIQSVSSKELQQLNEFNISGELRKVYLHGSWNGIVRKELRGGDIFEFDESAWLVVQQSEQWPDWCCVFVQRQLDDVQECWR